MKSKLEVGLTNFIVTIPCAFLTILLFVYGVGNIINLGNYIAGVGMLLMSAVVLALGIVLSKTPEDKKNDY